MNEEYPKIYLAYGSNLNIGQMQYRCPTAEVFATAKLHHYRLLFRGGRYGAVATIEPKRGSYVPVGLWRIEKSDEKALDAYEGWPRLYRKEDFRVRVGMQWIRCFAYVMNEGHRLGEPSQPYLDTIVEGYESMNLNFAALDKALTDSMLGTL